MGACRALPPHCSCNCAIAFGCCRSAFVVLGESMALAEAARTQLEAVGTVSRRPATLCCFSVFEEIAHVVEEAGVEGFQLDDCVRGKEGEKLILFRSVLIVDGSPTNSCSSECCTRGFILAGLLQSIHVLKDVLCPFVSRWHVPTTVYELYECLLSGFWVFLTEFHLFEVRRTALSQTSFDKRCLVLPRSKVPPVVDVVVVGAGLLGMLTAHRCTSAGFSVAVLEQRPVIGGIWSMYANSTSQVNSSEGGYCIKDILGEDQC